MLFRFFWALTAAALTLSFAGWGLQALGLTLSAEYVGKIAANLLVAGFALLYVAIAMHVLKTIAIEVAHYFSQREAARRKLLSAEALRRDLEQRHASELRQLEYFRTLERMQLVRANDNKHMRLLAKSLYRQLRTARANMPKALYRELKQAVGASHRRRDSGALLALQKQIAVYQL